MGKKGIILYTSKRGSTKEYAEWIADEIRDSGYECEAVPYDSGKATKSRINLYEYDLIIYGGWIRGSGIVDFDKFKGELDEELLNRLLIFGVGIANESSDNYMQVYDINYKGIFKDGEKNPTLYILSGRYDPNKITGIDKMMMGVMKKVLMSGSTKDAKPDADNMKNRIINGIDLVDKNNIKAIVKEAKSILA